MGARSGLGRGVLMNNRYLISRDGPNLACTGFVIATLENDFFSRRNRYSFRINDDAKF
jgi:hypothetical protein